jgi:hypothetical protein
MPTPWINPTTGSAFTVSAQGELSYGVMNQALTISFGLLTNRIVGR